MVNLLDAQCFLNKRNSLLIVNPVVEYLFKEKLKEGGEVHDYNSSSCKNVLEFQRLD